MPSPFLTFSISVLLLLALIRLAPRVGLIDHPNGRKQHNTPTPAVGGVAILLSSLTLLASPDFVASPYLWLLPTLGLLAVLGLMDDIREIPYKVRVVIQLLAGLMMALLGGVVLSDFGNLLGTGEIRAGVLVIPLTLFAVASAVNALNLCDGVDGLASGLALIPLVILAGLAASAGLMVPAAVAATFSAGLLAFMLFNFPFPWLQRARCFLGDAGSSVLGLVLVWLMIDLSQQKVMDPITALYLLGLPLLDTAAVIIRRRRAGLSPMAPGRDHLHHVLLDAGLSPLQTVLSMQFVGLLFAVVGVLFSMSSIPESVAFGVYLVCMAGFLVVTRSPKELAIRLQAFFRSSRGDAEGGHAVHSLIVIPGGRDGDLGLQAPAEASADGQSTEAGTSVNGATPKRRSYSR